MHLNTKCATAIFVLLSTNVFAQAPKVVCEINAATGKLQATTAWRNVLGNEADEACAKALPIGTQNNTPAFVPMGQRGQMATHTPPSAAPMPPSVTHAPPIATPVANPINVALARPVEPAATNNVAISAPVQAPASKTPAIIERHWQVELKDITLANTFARWADTANYRVRWDADKNVLVDAPDKIYGTFEDALTAVLSSPGITQGAYPLEVCFYTNNPPLARVTRKGEQKDCQ